MNWGFTGYGRIARKFEENLAHTDHKLVAIASRSGYDQIKAPIKAYQNYKDLYADTEVDIVYVNTTHNDHCSQTIAALHAGKHVLCEKPLGTSESEVIQMIEAARANDKFLMEAIWTRYLPAYQKVISLVKNGAIGEIQMVHANFGFRMNPEDPKERLINPDLAAGAVWDVGIYPLSLAQDIFNQYPQNIQVSAKLSPLNVEDRCAIQLTYGEGQVAQLSCAIDLNSVNDATIIGSEGSITLRDFWKCEQFTLKTTKDSKDFHLPYVSTGLYHEAMACATYIENNIHESSLITFDNSRELARLMDEVILLSRSKEK